MTSARVAVLRGGPGAEYDMSLKTGAYFLEHCAAAGHAPRDIFITRDGQWHMAGVPTTPDKAFRHVDVVMSAMHDARGGAEPIQKLFRQHGVGYVGSDSMAGALASQKHLSRELFLKNGLRAPISWVVTPDDFENFDDLLYEIRREVAPPWVVKPSGGGSSVGTSLVWDPHKLAVALEQAFFVSETALIEEFVRGEEVTVFLLDDFRGQEQFAFFPVHIRKDKWALYRNEDKKGTSVRFDCPAATLLREIKDHVAELSKKVHSLVGARDLSRVDMIVNPRGAYVLEINTSPAFGPHTPIAAALEAHGVADKELVDHLVKRAFSRVY
jgi:D-alanine-D-alanine ligase